MLEKLEIDNFKAFNDFSITLKNFTAIIGDNASCKTSILQVISFLKYSCLSHTDNFLSKRGLTVSDLASKFSKKRNMTLTATFNFENTIVNWKIVFTLDKAQNSIILNNETVSSNNSILLHYDRDGNSYRIAVDGSKNPIMNASFDHSIIKLIDITKDITNYPTLVRIKRFFSNTEDLDLLSPSAMRKSSQGESFEVGLSGEKLSSFIKTLSADQREALAQDVNNFTRSFSQVNPKTKQYGWVHLETVEKYKDYTIEITSSNISDGILRIIAFCALKYVNHDNGVILLDEIEDGLNNKNLKKLILLLRTIQQQQNIQIIATTHSTVLLDDWCDDPDNPGDASIQVMLRDERTGVPKAYDFFTNPFVKEYLNYQFPGEIVLNTSNEEFNQFFQEEAK